MAPKKYTRQTPVRRDVWLLAAILGACLFCASSASAQILPIPPAPADALSFPNPSATPIVHALLEPVDGYLDEFRFWVRTDYLLGWVRQAPASLPLVTTGDSKNKVPGAIGQAGTTVLFGNASIGFKVISGLRLTWGAWVDPARVVGVEATVFATERRANNFTDSADDTGKPLLAVPFVSQTPTSPVESAHLLSRSQKLTGDVLVASSLQRGGADLSGLYCVWRQPGFEFSLLTGIRYEDLEEGMRILQQSFNLATRTNTTLDDEFKTRNQFFGGQLGMRVLWQYDVWVIAATTKVAVGGTHQVVDIQGDSSQFGVKAAPAGSFPGGLFAQPSNIGRTAANSVVAIPSLEMRLGYQVTPRLRVFAGYEILYWNQVVRPGNQIDRNINVSQSSVLGTTQGALTGPALPAALFNRSGFWAQDVNFGLELRF